MNRLVIYFLTLSITLITVSAHAETFRCNGSIISEGMTREQVRSECGSPDEVVTQTHYYWVYKRDGGDLDVRVYFYANGEVEKIDSFRE
ncbi:MAG: DUF2845 domain-containing protein [Gammaproteobacteria bacterium]